MEIDVVPYHDRIKRCSCGFRFDFDTKRKNNGEEWEIILLGAAGAGIT